MSIMGDKCNTMKHPNGHYPEPVSALSAESRILIFKLKKMENNLHRTGGTRNPIRYGK